MSKPDSVLAIDLCILLFQLDRKYSMGHLNDLTKAKERLVKEHGYRVGYSNPWEIHEADVRFCCKAIERLEHYKQRILRGAEIPSLEDDDEDD